MKTIMQEDKYGCGIACVAMYHGISYQYAKEKYAPNNDFTKHGLSVESMAKFMGGNILVADMILSGVGGILLVPSLNEVGSLHYILYDNDFKLHDPNTGTGLKTYNHNNLVVLRHLVNNSDPRSQKYIKNKIKYLSGFLK